MYILKKPFLIGKLNLKIEIFKIIFNILFRNFELINTK